MKPKRTLPVVFEVPGNPPISCMHSLSASNGILDAGAPSRKIVSAPALRGMEKDVPPPLWPLSVAQE
ncbi:MAG: hypothetical protein KIS77_05895 [Saprospiraceae bacterium]|nr:hypothetical protein [Saprospiraceae bacterium]